MARLQVGDIQIDGSDIRIGGRNPGLPEAAGTDARTGTGTDVSQAVRVLDHIPFSPRTLVMAGLAAVIAGTVVNVVLGAWNDPLGVLVRGGILAPLGVGIVMLGAAKQYLRRKPEVRHRAALGADADRYLDTLRQILAQPSPQQTIGWIGQRTGWPEADVVHALALLRTRGELLEEIDLESGEFYYVAQPQPLTLGPADLDTRLGNLTPEGAPRT